MLLHMEKLARVMRKDVVFREQMLLLVLAIPPKDLAETNKDNACKFFTKVVLEMLEDIITNVHGDIPETEFSVSIVMAAFAVLQHLTKNPNKNSLDQIKVA